MVRISDIQDNKINWNTVPYCNIEQDKINEYTLNINDILFARTGGTVGKSFLVNFLPEAAIFAGYLIRTVYSDELSSHYLKLFMESSLYWKQLKSGTIATAQPNCNGNTLSKMFIPIPPIEEQRRIVNKIKELEPLIDKYKTIEEQLYNLNSAIKDNLKKSILQYAVEGKLVPQDPSDEPASVLLEKIKEEKQKLILEGKIKKDKHEAVIYRRDNSYYEKIDGVERCINDEIPFDIPNSWEWCRLKDIGKWGAGSTPSKNNPEYYKDATIPWLLTGDLNDGYITKIPNKINKLALKETSLKINPKGSILIAMYGATIGKLGILSIEAATNQACCACQVFDGIHNKYLFYFLMSNKHNFTKLGEGGAQPNISKYKIENTLFPLPPLNEQYLICNKISIMLDLIK